MSSFKCFLKNSPSFPWIQIPILVITLSILLSSNSVIWLKTCILVLVFLSAFIFSFLTQQKASESNLDNRSKNEDAHLSNELENKLLFQESHLHSDDHSDVAQNGGRKKVDSARMSSRLKENPSHADQDVGDISYSESESNNVSFLSEDYSDMEWPYSSSRLQLVEQSSSPDFSAGSISDEESLIELEIPSGIYVASPTQTKKGKQEEDQEFISKLCNFHQFKDPIFDFFDTETKNMFKKQSILDLLTEVNEMNIEEDNLIEIDIAMGSIKCPRFEIEA